MKAIDLIFDAYALRIVDDNLEITIFSSNLGSVRILLPLENLAEYFGAIGHALEEIREGNE